jgi:hypothetical protein
LDNKKAPTENGITGQIFKQTFQNLPIYTDTTYKECLRKGTLAKRWKRAKHIPIVKSGKEGSEQVTKYRQLSLLNTQGKIWRKY